MNNSEERDLSSDDREPAERAELRGAPPGTTSSLAWTTVIALASLDDALSTSEAPQEAAFLADVERYGVVLASLKTKMSA